MVIQHNAELNQHKFLNSRSTMNPVNGHFVPSFFITDILSQNAKQEPEKSPTESTSSNMFNAEIPTSKTPATVDDSCNRDLVFSALRSYLHNNSSYFSPYLTTPGGDLGIYPHLLSCSENMKLTSQFRNASEEFDSVLLRVIYQHARMKRGLFIAASDEDESIQTQSSDLITSPSSTVCGRTAELGAYYQATHRTEKRHSKVISEFPSYESINNNWNGLDSSCLAADKTTHQTRQKATSLHSVRLSDDTKITEQSVASSLLTRSSGDDNDQKNSVKSGGLCERKTPQSYANSALDALIHMTASSMQRLSRKSDFSDGSIDASEISCINRGAQIAKRRKTRTTFSNSQLIELENNFNRQKYLTPSDRDRIAKHLGLTNTQVITWFQNRRAKLKREAEELERDILAARQQEHRKLFEISSGPEFGEKRVRSEDVICSDQTDFSDEWKITHSNGPSSEVASSPDMNSVLSIHRLVGDRSPKPPKLALLNGGLDKQKPTKPQANLLWSPAEEIDEKWRKSGE